MAHPSVTDIVHALECASSASGITLNIKGTPDAPLFQVNQIGQLLGFNSIRSTIRDFHADKKTIHKFNTGDCGDRSVAFLTLAGLRHLVAASRKPAAIDMARLLGIDVIHCKIPSFEATTLRQIMDAFRGEEMVVQYPIGSFYVDMYFPKFRLALECDERRHDNAEQKRKDSERQQYIKSQLRCEFIRYKPHADGFCIFAVINQIYVHISRYKDAPDSMIYDIMPASSTDEDHTCDHEANTLDGWTAEQTLDKLRLEALPETMQALTDAMKALPSISDTAARIDIERSIANIMRDLSRTAFAEPTVEPAAEPTAEPAAEPAAAPHLVPPQPKRKLGRPPRAKVPPAATADTPLQRFLDECFDLDGSSSSSSSSSSSGTAKTHVAHVRARHRLWRGSHVSRGETNDMVEFFKQRFAVVQEMDGGHDMTCSFYRGLAMKPWAPRPFPSPPSIERELPLFRPDVDAFVREACEVHVMGRARTADLWTAFVAWKQAPASPKDRELFVAHMKTAFVYHTGVPIAKDAVGAPGFYGLYLATATEECREVGYNRSPNTHAAVLKLDALGNVVDTIESQDAFAHGVAKRSPQHICKELTKCFRNGMKGFMPGDGYAYMRAADHVALLAAQAAQASQAAQAAQGAQGA